MDDDIKTLFYDYKENQQQTSTHEGRLIQFLKENQYFEAILNKYGIEVFRLYLPLLQYRIYRDGTVLVHNQDILVINKGKIVLLNHQNHCQKQWVDGMLVQPQNNSKLIFKSSGNTSIIKIGKSTQKQKKTWQKIKKIQKQQLTKINNINTELSKDENLLNILSIIQQISYFQDLGEFDKKQLASNCCIQFIKKQQYTHQKGQQCRRVGYILSGTVKMIYFGQIQPKHKFDTYVTKYMVKKCVSEKQGIVFSQLRTGNWIGLQQNMLQNHYSCSGKVTSQQCKILWIPATVFIQKFNEKTSFTQTSRLKNVLAAKKLILNRSLLSKQEKQSEMNKQVERLKINEQNTNKLKQLNLNELYRVGHTQFRRTHKHSNSGLQFPSKMASQLIKLQRKKSFKLPGLNSTINFFPQQFQKATLPNDIGNDYDIRQVKQIFYSRKKKQTMEHDELSTTSSKKPLERNPDIIRKLIQNTSRFRTFEKEKEKIQQTCTQKKRKTLSQTKILLQTQKNKTRFNNSIYNNFKITSRKNLSGFLKKP